LPKVSVIMPVYNTETYVAQAIESILAQTFTDFEFIIVDDGSTDRTPAILDAFSRSDNRVRIIHNPVNRGPAACRNIGLNNSSGEYIALMDADDISKPERLAKQSAYLHNHPDVFVLGSSVQKLTRRTNR